MDIKNCDKLKVLCIHGYRQNENSFKSKLGSFRKFLNKYVEFEFVSAPHTAPPLETSMNGITSESEVLTDYIMIKCS